MNCVFKHFPFRCLILVLFIQTTTSISICLVDFIYSQNLAIRCCFYDIFSFSLYTTFIIPCFSSVLNPRDLLSLPVIFVVLLFLIPCSFAISNLMNISFVTSCFLLFLSHLITLPLSASHHHVIMQVGDFGEQSSHHSRAAQNFPEHVSFAR